MKKIEDDQTLGLEPDPDAFSLPLDETGWVHEDETSQEVKERKEYLKINSGIKGLQLFDYDELDEIVKVFYRDGFVVVREVLDSNQLDYLRSGVDREIHNILALDKHRVGNRGSHRYSFGGASLTGHQMHNPEWAMLIDLPKVTPILTALFGSSTYIARGGGGDFCLPGAVRYQPLHSDMSDRRQIGGQTFGSFHDPRGIMNYRDLPCPYICCNFLTVDFQRDQWTHPSNPWDSTFKRAHSKSQGRTRMDEVEHSLSRSGWQRPNPRHTGLARRDTKSLPGSQGHTQC